MSKFHNVNFFLDIPFMPTLLIVAILSYSDESTLILIRHGESLWNEKNLFSGCVDVPLTNKGIEEAIEAGKRIRNLPIDIIYTSALIRAQMTAMLALTQHRCYKVLPIDVSYSVFLPYLDEPKNSKKRINKTKTPVERKKERK